MQDSQIAFSILYICIVIYSKQFENTRYCELCELAGIISLMKDDC